VDRLRSGVQLTVTDQMWAWAMVGIGLILCIGIAAIVIGVLSLVWQGDPHA
jgi:hypothetical protein